MQGQSKALVEPDIGGYDGGFELDNVGRGSAVHGQAAEILNMDSINYARQAHFNITAAMN
jgi:hypothetical protein